MAPHYHHHSHPPWWATDALVYFFSIHYYTYDYLDLIKYTILVSTLVVLSYESLAHHSCPIMPNSLEWCTIVQGILLLTLHLVHHVLFSSLGSLCK